MELKKVAVSYSGVYVVYVVEYGMQTILAQFNSFEDAERFAIGFYLTNPKKQRVYVSHDFHIHKTFVLRSKIKES